MLVGSAALLLAVGAVSSASADTAECSYHHGHLPIHHEPGVMKAGHGCKKRLPVAPGHKCPSCTRGTIDLPYIVIPTYERDLCKLTYTLNSIAKHDRHHNLGNVIIMWVSRTPMSAFAARIVHAIQHVARTRHVTVRDFQPQVVSQGGMAPWIIQQVWKLKIAQWVPSEYYIVLDSKNTFLKTITRRTFFNKCNQAIRQGFVPISRLPQLHAQWYYKSAQELGAPVPAGGHWAASISPIVMHKWTVLKMLKHLHEYVDQGLSSTCSGGLCPALTRGATEFTMYNLYAYHFEDFKCIHTIQAPKKQYLDWTSANLWRFNDWFQQNRQLRTLQRMQHNKHLPLVIGAQAGALNNYPVHGRYQATQYLENIFRRADLHHQAKTTANLQKFYYCVVSAQLFENGTEAWHNGTGQQLLGLGPSRESSQLYLLLGVLLASLSVLALVLAAVRNCTKANSKFVLLGEQV